MKKTFILLALVASLLSCEKEDVKNESIEIEIDQNSYIQTQKELTSDEFLNSKSQKRSSIRTRSSIESGKGIAAKKG